MLIAGCVVIALFIGACLGVWLDFHDTFTYLVRLRVQYPEQTSLINRIITDLFGDDALKG